MIVVLITGLFALLSLIPLIIFSILALSSPELLTQAAVIVATVSCIISFISSTATLATYFFSYTRYFPQINIRPVKSIQSTKIPFVSQVKFNDTSYIVLCVSLENVSNNKTLARNISLSSPVSFQKKLPFFKRTKYYNVDKPEFLVNNENFDFIKNFEVVTTNFVINDFDFKQTCFIFPIDNVVLSKKYKLKIKITGKTFPLTFKFSIPERYLTVL